MEKKHTYRPKCCAECGDSFQPRRHDEYFCSIPCRKTFDNRAMTRGRDLYHLFMVMRYERGLAKALGVWAIICRMAMEWRKQDNEERDGRASWMAPQRAIDKLPVTIKCGDVYVGQIRK